MSTKKTIAVVCGTVHWEAREDELAVLADVERVSAALRVLGYEPVFLEATLDLATLVNQLQELKPLCVFNLVESIATFDSLLHVVPSVLEAFHIPFTGVSSQANFCTTDKILAKQIMHSSGIATPGFQRCDEIISGGFKLQYPVIVKPVAADASIGMGDDCVCADDEALRKKVESVALPDRAGMFAEEYIDGREFNISMIATSEAQAQMLPPAEMTFVDYPPGKPAIVDFRAKWIEGSFEYTHTIRSFEFSAADQPLLQSLEAICLQCWRVFGLDGYARVDFRVDKKGMPWVLEINGNPCISADAGFAVAAQQAGITYDELIGRIVDIALKKNNGKIV